MINSSVKVLIYWCAFAIPFGVYTFIDKKIDFNLAILDTYTMPSSLAKPIFLSILFGVTILLIIFTFMAKSMQNKQH